MHSASRPLPLHPHWSSPEEYVDSLLNFVTTTDLFRNLCGGVHVLDFLTREPDIYSQILPAEWREWVAAVDINDFLDLLLRENLSQFDHECSSPSQGTSHGWRGHPDPPKSLVEYIHTIRIYSLVRDFKPVSPDIKPLPIHVSVGMKVKKVHEVNNFAAYVDRLSASLSDSTSKPLSIIDFGSGQNYLGRTLACPPYNKNVIAIEQRHHNVEGAKWMDVQAKLTEKEKVMRNKKEYRRQLAKMGNKGAPPTPPESSGELPGLETPSEPESTIPVIGSVPETINPSGNSDNIIADPTKGSMTYIEHALSSGHLEDILSSNHPATSPNPDSDSTTTPQPNSLVVSIHSCGNLTHHGLRSLTLNPSVRAVAMIGCCYNLLTERLGPPTYKHPALRSNHPRLEATSSTYDPHGLPMSHRLATHAYQVPSLSTPSSSPHLEPQTSPSNPTKTEVGLRLNITARMMAVHAPYNWTPLESKSFFTRHFYRALLQRMLLDRGVVHQALSPSALHTPGNSLSGKDAHGTPLIIGSLRKSAFVSFHAYIAAALQKLTDDPVEGPRIAQMTRDMAEGSVVDTYEKRYGYARKQLAVIWSLMAFSAGVAESVIAVDRWLWLTEQPEVERAWVEVVFDYALSPRNLCVVGIKKTV